MGWCYDVSPTLTWWLGAERERFLVRNWTLLVDPRDHHVVRDIAASLQRGELPPPRTLNWIDVHGKIVATECRMFWRKYAADGAPHFIIGRVTRLLEEAVA